jgi:polysaccharide chain length determinant protein (PEP-CTERM system associated)
MQNITTIEGIKPEDIIEIVIKRRWFIIIPFFLAMIAGISLAIMLPKIYEASTLILIQPQKVPTDYVQSIVSTDIDSRISTISQQILSRTNIEKIIEEFKLFSTPEQKNIYIEDKIEAIRKKISVDLIRQDRRRPADAFSITYKGKDPEKVMGIANTLAFYFINENLKVREAQAVGTSDFLDEELKGMRKNLEVLEEQLKNYREKYMGELPEQLETNLRILDRLQAQLTAKQESLRDEKNSLLALEKYMANTQGLTTSDGRIQIQREDPVSLEGLKQQVADLKTKYTDRHPDVIRLNKMIADLEKKLVKNTAEGLNNSQPGVSGTTSGSVPEAAMQREEIKLNIKKNETIISELISQIDFYQKRVENTPKREQELLSLQRDYENVKETYSSILNRKLEAEMAVNMEKKQKGEQFRIIDPARLPTKPIEPDMKKLFMLVVAAGLGIGAGLIFLLEYINTSFLKPEEIEAFLGVPVMATVPEIYQPRDRKRQRYNQFLSIFFILISFALFAGFTVLTLKGV